MLYKNFFAFYHRAPHISRKSCLLSQSFKNLQRNAVFFILELLAFQEIRMLSLNGILPFKKLISFCHRTQLISRNSVVIITELYTF